MLEECLRNVRAAHPLVHCITNYVTVNDVANMLLASGGSPIMADAVEEAAEITSICDALVVNIGTLNARTIPAMYEAGKKAASLQRPLVLDPVGAGASSLRTETARGLLDEIPFTLVRGNMSEIKTLAVGSGTTRGVDADVADSVTEENLSDSVAFVKAFAGLRSCMVAVTGAIDLVSDAKRCYVIRNGRPEMGRITGTGCQLSALTAAFLAANPGNLLEAVAAAVSLMGLAGELAFARLQPGDGNSAYRGKIIDTVYSIDGATFAAGARCELL